jgi:hypothetical protein
MGKSIPHPDTNFTGMLNLGLDIAAKRLQLLKELLPSIARGQCSETPAINRRRYCRGDSRELG